MKVECIMTGSRIYLDVWLIELEIGCNHEIRYVYKVINAFIPSNKRSRYSMIYVYYDIATL